MWLILIIQPNGYPGVTLTVTDLQVESPERVTEGDSVRLTCKSSCTLTDRATFIWYRNSQPLTERRDRNNELLLQSVRREDAGRYSCAVHGHNHISPAVQLNVTLHHRLGWHVWLGITVACLGFFIIIIIILFIMRKRKGAQVEDLTAKQDNLYSNVTGRDVHVSESADCDDAQYATVTSSKPRRDRNAPDRRDTEEIQYATVQHPKNKQTKRSEENESQYGNIRIHQPESAVRRSNVETVDDASVIYSRVK
ncbi:carcinoembryonic antigen-related cell adhesion molecule 1-like [Megalobrama amblycephala]|uniref:carcinoembryonic antigen-related cell adhesion molecule 1-like n=1 Tax=Megalobrama amblycephala TaxID=75352 RepID=UPI00201415F4|nr:carcinoembryonic antigen-related cell adhesion molecule 1-like [Megalobrama amblycephala]